MKSEKEYKEQSLLILTPIIILSVIQIILTLVTCMYVLRHSVHPVYGEYQQKTLGCAPWDACKPDNKCKNER
jgi:hypothetical protein